jgi:type I restriction enzyme R subunit
MPITPEDRARENIDKLLTDAGWIVQDKRSTNLSAARGVAVREFPLKSGHGEADYLLFVDGAPIGVVEAKKEGDTLTGVELQTTKYSEGVPDNLTTPRRPLPFQYQSTGVETRFTNLLEQITNAYDPDAPDLFSHRAGAQRLPTLRRRSRN